MEFQTVVWNSRPFPGIPDKCLQPGKCLEFLTAFVVKQEKVWERSGIPDSGLEFQTEKIGPENQINLLGLVNQTEFEDLTKV